jgi:hypothetical protein
MEEMMKKILLLLCAAALLFASCRNPADSSSDEEEEEELRPEGPIRIGVAADLARIGSDKDFPADGDYELAADIELNNWTPLCTEEAPFSGSLNGNGRKISIKGFSSTELKYIGVFAYIKGGTTRAEVKNLNIAFTSGSLDLNSGSNQYIAALAGYAAHTALDNIAVSGSLTVNKTAGNALYAAGVAAYLEQSTLSNCVSSAAISAGNSRGVFSGGIAGYGNSGIVITGCRVGGSLTVKTAATEASAGGIIGTIRDTGKDSLVSLCTVTANVSLKMEGAAGAYNMFYSGGVIGYAGNGTTGEGAGGVKIFQSRYEGGTVECKTTYPYSGGIIGYNYTGSEVSQCYSTGTVSAEGSNLPYSGGVAGYASRGALIVNSYSAAAVSSVAGSKQALAGGIAGATAAGAVILKCYASGTVRAQTGNSAAGAGGSVGVPAAANAGGITGALYSGGGPAPRVEYCAALNGSVEGIGGATNVYRIAKNADGTLLSNIAWKDMPLTGGTGSAGTLDGEDGLDNTTRQPGEGTAGTTLLWDTTGVWFIPADGYPVLRWQ